MISNCCGAPPWMEIDDYNMGICSRCKEHAEFIEDEDESTPLRREAEALGALYSTIADFKKILGGKFISDDA